MNRKIIAFFLILFFLFSKNLFATETSFDKKPDCLNQGGNWRKFANSCVDSCKAKFDDMMICSQAITYSCDCGEEKCTDEEGKCVLKTDYEIIFKEKKKLEKTHLEKLREERIEKFTSDPKYAYEIHNLYPKPPIQDPNNKDSKAKNSDNRQIASQAQQNNSSNNNSAQNQNVSTAPVLRQIPPAYQVQKQQNSAPINSSGKPQDLEFPVIPLPEN